MNFLSHFYFDQNTANPNIVLGCILPDLLKNANKDWNPHPQKHPELFEDNATHKALLNGWKRHLAVDLQFHSSAFFNEKMQELKMLLLPILKDSVVRPSFLAHIGVELLLDHLLIAHHKIKIEALYEQLEKTKEESIETFLTKCNITETAHFFKFFNNFQSGRYLFSYQKIENISYALHRICMRLWAHPFSEKTTQELTAVLEFYKTQLEVDFMVIFDEIENRLT